MCRYSRRWAPIDVEGDEVEREAEIDAEGETGCDPESTEMDDMVGDSACGIVVEGEQAAVASTGILVSWMAGPEPDECPDAAVVASSEADLWLKTGNALAPLLTPSNVVLLGSPLCESSSAIRERASSVWTTTL